MIALIALLLMVAGPVLFGRIILLVRKRGRAMGAQNRAELKGVVSEGEVWQFFAGWLLLFIGVGILACMAVTGWPA